MTVHFAIIVYRRVTLTEPAAGEKHSRTQIMSCGDNQVIIVTVLARMHVCLVCYGPAGCARNAQGRVLSHTLQRTRILPKNWNVCGKKNLIKICAPVPVARCALHTAARYARPNITAHAQKVAKNYNASDLSVCQNHRSLW